MPDPTPPVTPEPVTPEQPPAESLIGGVSVRAIVVLMIVATVCTLQLLAREVGEPLYTLSIFALGYLFNKVPARLINGK